MFAKVDKYDELDHSIQLPVNYSALNYRLKKAVREQYIKVQGGRCCYCNGRFDEAPPPGIANKKVHPELFPINFFEYLIHLHHNHETGLTIGAVHAHCNAVSFEYDGI